MIIDTLAEWNPWWKEKHVAEELLGKERDDLNVLKNALDFREMKLLIGVRRCGKSTLFYQLINQLLNNNVSPQEILLVNFEDDVLSKKTLREIFDAYQSNLNPDTKPYVFLDEVHRCADWTLFLRKLYDLKKVKQIYITDSSSKFVKSEYAKSLTGRNISLSVFPISFREYLRWRELNISLPIDREDINKIKKELVDFLQWGGFPEVFFKIPAAKKKLLTDYFSDIIDKDIVERYNVSYARIKPLADFLVSNATASFSPRKYSRTYGLSLESINTYVEYFKEVFLFFFLPRFSYSIAAQQLSSKKVYVCDLGFFNNTGFKFSENIGKAYENIVFIELMKRGKELYYWKDRHECDFLVKEGLKISDAIQVCAEITVENKKREINGLTEALNKFDLVSGLIITSDYETEEIVEGKTLKFIPLWKWLLSGASSDVLILN